MPHPKAMPHPSDSMSCPQAELACAYALRAVASEELPAIEAHVASCPSCRSELETLRPLVDAFAYWPTDVLRAPPELPSRLAGRLWPAAKAESASPASAWDEPEWHEVGPGISCKLLTDDTVRHRVGMLVRLAPGAHYPPHTHAGVEELHLLDGELWIDARKLRPGDYNRAEAGTADKRVWSEIGCTCVLLTSTQDVLD